MPWYLAVYLMVFVAFGAAGVVDDWRSRRPRLLVLAMVFATGVGALSIVAFARPDFARSLGWWLWPAIAFALVFEAISVWLDQGELAEESKSSFDEDSVLVAIVIAVTLPAYIFGAAAAWRVGG